MKMDERKMRILRAIIDDYILTGVPVGSRTISRKYETGLSSATIRNEMSDLEELRKTIVQFTQERDWDQFHNGKDLALALSIEVAELNEAFLWKDASKVNVEKVKEELADIFNYAILLADKYNLDIKQIVLDKLQKNAEKYPVDKAYGSAKKYNEL